jgi:voltage-gated potassium channel
MSSVKRRIYEIVEREARGDRASRLFDLSLLTLILLNIVAVCAETVKPWYRAVPHLFDAFYAVSVAIFSVEYLVRLWVITENPRYRHPVWGRLRFAVTPLALIDLLAVVPWYLPLLRADLRFLRSARFVRLLRVAKVGRYSLAVRALGGVLREKREELAVSAVIMGLLLLCSAGVMYFVEHAAQPDKFSSVPEAMWWAVTTVTAVGYGDVYPVTPLGKVLGSLIAILGVGVFALPAGILCAGFIQHVEAQKKPRRICPHCHKPVDYEP